MELELKRGGRTARVETLGGELVSYRDERGLEYIWGGDPAYWPGRNPLLFPIVGMLKEGKIRFDGREYAMERHGFARRREFTPAARGEDWVRLELRESAETLALYPYSFRLAVERGFGIELDVQLSKDKVPVVFHDDSLLRVCGVDKKVGELTLAELKTLRLLDSAETIPTFEEFLQLVNGRVPLIVEIKMAWMNAEVCPAAQALLDDEEDGQLPALAASWQPEQWETPPCGEIFPDALRFLGELDILDPAWRMLLRRAETTVPALIPEELLERVAAYVIFRYPLKAVNDGDLLGRTAFCVFAVLTVERLAAVCGLPEALRQFSREIEHSQENLEALQNAFWSQPWFQLPRLLGTLVV